MLIQPRTHGQRSGIPVCGRVSVFELAGIMGTSVAMIERSYGTLIEGAGADIARRLAAFEGTYEQAAEASGPHPGQRPPRR